MKKAIYSPPSQRTNCRSQVSGLWPDTKRDTAEDLGRAAAASNSSCSMQEPHVPAKRAEFLFLSMARPTLGRRHFQVARNRVRDLGRQRAFDACDGGATSAPAA